MPSASSPPAWKSRCSTAQLGGQAVDVPHQPAHRVARRERRTPPVPVAADVEGAGSRPAKPSASTGAAPVRHQRVGVRAVGVAQRRQQRHRCGRRATRRRSRPRSGRRVPSGWGCSAPSRARAARTRSGSSGLPASCTSAAPSAAGFGARLAQWCIAQPPATSAAPISASRWMLRPVMASVPPAPPDPGAVADVRLGRRRSTTGSSSGWRRRRRRSCCRWCRRGSPTWWRPAAGLAVRISGTTQAAAPAVATADIRPSAWRLENVRPERASPGATGDAPTSRFVRCLGMSSVRSSVVSGGDFTAVLPPRRHLFA